MCHHGPNDKEYHMRSQCQRPWSEQEAHVPKREKEQKGVQLCPRAIKTFSRPVLSVDEHAATRHRAAKQMEWMPTKSGPSPQTEPTATSLEVIALYGPAVVH